MGTMANIPSAVDIQGRCEKVRDTEAGEMTTKTVKKRQGRDRQIRPDTDTADKAPRLRIKGNRNEEIEEDKASQENTMTHDDELIERAAKVLHAEWMPEEGKFEQNSEEYREAFRDAARKLVTAVRAFDAERRASVLDVEALKSFDPKTKGTLVWLPDGLAHLMREWNDYDPDDYRDLPVSLERPAAFSAGLTTEKRK